MINSNIDTVKVLVGILACIIITVSVDQAIAVESNAVERCAGLGDVQSIALTDWESGLGLWTAGTHDVSNPEHFDTPDWATVGGLPDSRPGAAAFVADQNNGNCIDDPKTGALTLDSPSIIIPAGALVPRISINHWFATDWRWDGGNLKISVNGSSFNLIPGFAIEVGTYNNTLFTAFDNKNLNPLQGQAAFASDNNQPVGSWQQSHINLLGIAEVGDTIKLRFDFGIDECDGNIGWYVDEVEFYSCSSELPPSGSSLTLVKEVINDNSGGASPADWTLMASGPTPLSGSGPTVFSDASFEAGTYDLSESGGPAGYSASAWICVGGTQINTSRIKVAVGEFATCTIKNDDIAPTLKVFKTVINDNGGTVFNPNDFGLRVDGNIVAHNATNAFNTGSYIVSEDGHAGYTAGDWGGDCDTNGNVTLEPGQVATCTITNDDIPPSTIRVVKTIINDNGGIVTDPNAFGLKVDGSSVMNNVSNTFIAGNHTVSEDGLADYKAGSWGGDCNANGAITLTVGQDAICTITNNDIDLTDIIYRDGFE